MFELGYDSDLERSLMEQYIEGTLGNNPPVPIKNSTNNQSTDPTSTSTITSTEPSTNNEKPHFVFISDADINKMINDTLKN